MARNDVVNKDGSLNLDNIGGFKEDIIENYNEYSYTLGFLDGLNQIRTRQILEVNGFYSLGDGADGKYRVLAVDGSEVWTNVTTNGGKVLYQISNTGEIRLQNGVKKLRVRSKNGKYNVKMFGAKGDGIQYDNVAIQHALDNAIGTLEFPDGIYRVTGTGEACLYLNKKLNIDGIDARTTSIRGDDLGVNTDVIKISITSNSNNSDVRNWNLKNIRVFINGGGRHAIFIGNDEDYYPILQSKIENNNLSGNPSNNGYSLYIDRNLAHSTICGNTIQSEIYAKCRDANTIRENTFFGRRIAVTFDVIFGVHNNTVKNNTIVTRDGAVHIINGDVVRVQNNQIELALVYGEENQSPTSSMVWVEGRDRVSYNTIIEDNNFGGGTNLDHLNYIDNAQNTVITKNHFVATNVAEVYFTVNSKHNKVKRDNRTRGTTSNPRPRTLFKEEVVDNGVGNTGVLKDSTTLAHQNGWSGGDYFKDESGIVHFITQLSGGTLTAGTVIGTLPEGFRPASNIYIPCGTSGGVGLLKITSGAGEISVAQALPSNAGLVPQSFISGATDS